MAVRLRPTRGAPGQHFLRSRRLAEELVRDAGIEAGDLVVDVGAGNGALTSALVRARARVLALELDPLLARELRRRFDGADVDVVEADATSWQWPRERFRVVSNLPFAGSGAILASLLRDPRSGLGSADVIVQWELAYKHAAVWPTTVRGACWQAWFEIAIVRRLSRHAFVPVPGVDAALVRFTRRERPLVSPAEHGRYRQFLESAFRGQAPLRRALRPWLAPRDLRSAAATLGFDAEGRPRDLDPVQWAGLFALVSASHARSARGRRRG